MFFLLMTKITLRMQHVSYSSQILFRLSYNFHLHYHVMPKSITSFIIQSHIVGMCRVRHSISILLNIEKFDASLVNVLFSKKKKMFKYYIFNEFEIRQINLRLLKKNEAK